MTYNVYEMNTIENNKPRNLDAFIFLSTPEDRSWNTIMYLGKNNCLPSEILKLNIKNDEQSINMNKKEIKNEFLNSTINNDLSKTIITCLRTVDSYVNNKKVIGIDISVMPIPIFTQILHFLYVRHRDKKIIIYYTEPEHYNLDNIFDFHSFNGEISIRAIPGFEGRTSQKDELQRILIYIIGFEMNQLYKLIPIETNPNVIIPFNGFPSYFPKYKDISLINNDVNYQDLDIEMVFAEANNPYETYNQINCLVDKYQNYSIDIIPAGTKPMALGACMYALKNGNNVRLLFPFSAELKNQSSIGKGKIWEYVID